MATKKKNPTRSGKRNNLVSMDTKQALMMDGDTGGGGVAWSNPVLQPALGDDTNTGSLQAMALPVDYVPTGPVFNTEPVDSTQPANIPVLVSDNPTPITPAPVWSPGHMDDTGFPAPSDPAQDEGTHDPIIHEVTVGQDGNVNIGPQTLPPAPPTDVKETVTAPNPAPVEEAVQKGLAWYWWLLIAIAALVLIVIISKSFKK